MSVSIAIFSVSPGEWVTLQSPQDEWYQISKKNLADVASLLKYLVKDFITSIMYASERTSMSHSITADYCGWSSWLSQWPELRRWELSVDIPEPEVGLTGVVARQWPESDWLRYSSPVLCAVLLYSTITTITRSHYRVISQTLLLSI